MCCQHDLDDYVLSFSVSAGNDHDLIDIIDVLLIQSEAWICWYYWWGVINANGHDNVDNIVGITTMTMRISTWYLCVANV